MELLNRADELIRLRKKGYSHHEIGQLMGVGRSTVGECLARIGDPMKGKRCAGGTMKEKLNARFLKRITCDFDQETLHQIAALEKIWGLPKAEIFRILVDWGLEALDGEEEKAVKEAARAIRDGEV